MAPDWRSRCRRSSVRCARSRKLVRASSPVSASWFTAWRSLLSMSLKAMSVQATASGPIDSMARPRRKENVVSSSVPGELNNTWENVASLMAQLTRLSRATTNSR